MKIAIGGERPVFVTSDPDFDGLTGVAYESEFETIQIKNKKGTEFKMWYDLHIKFDRLIAVWCPKSDNPAITMTVDGNYGGVYWVGLFVKNATDDTNNFMAVRTTNRLNPKCADLTRKYPGHEKYFRVDGPANLSEPGSHMTMYPKQLYGANPNSAELYDKFVTQDPFNAASKEHMKIANPDMPKPKDDDFHAQAWSSQAQA